MLPSSLKFRKFRNCDFPHTSPTQFEELNELYRQVVAQRTLQDYFREHVILSRLEEGRPGFRVWLVSGGARGVAGVIDVTGLSRPATVRVILCLDFPDCRAIGHSR